jgi:hypothetical protein
MRSAFLAFTLVLASGMILLAGLVWSKLVPELHALVATLVRFDAALGFISELGSSLLQGIPLLVRQGALLLLGLFYTAFFALGTAAYRLLVLNRQSLNK